MGILANVSLAPLDWVVVCLFCSAILALALSARLQKSTAMEYLTSGRNLTLPAFVATLVCTWYGGILGVGESVSSYGIGAWLLVGVPYYVFGLAYALWLAPRVRQVAQVSLPERLESRWGRGVGILAAALVFIFAAPAAHILMLGSLIHQFSGCSLGVGIGVASTIAIGLLYRGGLLADVRMAMLAFVGMYVGFAMMLLFCLTHYPPATTFAHLPDPNLLTFTGGQSWPVVLSFFILGAWTFVDPAFHQRVASAARPETSRRGVLVSVGFWVVFDILSIGTALYAVALLNPLPDTLAIYPALAQRVLPPGLRGLFLCGVLGTICSAMVAYTLVSGGAFGRDLVARIRPGLSESAQQGWVRVGLFCAVLAAAPVALAAQDSVVALWYSWAGTVVGAILIPVLLAYKQDDRRLPSSRIVFASILVSYLGSTSWMIYGMRTNNLFLEVNALKIDGAWRWMMSPVSAAWQARATDSLTIGVGTLLPSLVISAGILGLGKLFEMRTTR